MAKQFRNVKIAWPSMMARGKLKLMLVRTLRASPVGKLLGHLFGLDHRVLKTSLDDGTESKIGVRADAEIFRFFSDFGKPLTACSTWGKRIFRVHIAVVSVQKFKLY